MAQDEKLKSGGCQLMLVDTVIYSADCLAKAAYWFSANYHVRLQSKEGSQVEVILTLKDGGKALADLEHAFFDALLDQTIRAKVAKETEPLRNLIMAHAFSKTPFLNDAALVSSEVTP